MSPETVREIRDRAASALGFPDLHLDLSVLWGATADPSREISTPPESQLHYRARLRQALARGLPSTDRESEALQDLSRLPTHSSFSFSVSHCPNLGGYARVPMPAKIGFDIEIKDRVIARTVQRIRTSEDEEPPETAYLWSAKEAAFKCQLLSQQPKTLTHISIVQWKRLLSGAFSFRARRADLPVDLNGYGVVFEHGPWTLCFFLDSPQLKSRPSDRF